MGDEPWPSWHRAPRPWSSGDHRRGVRRRRRHVPHRARSNRIDDCLARVRVVALGPGERSPPCLPMAPCGGGERAACHRGQERPHGLAVDAGRVRGRVDHSEHGVDRRCGRATVEVGSDVDEGVDPHVDALVLSLPYRLLIVETSIDEISEVDRDEVRSAGGEEKPPDDPAESSTTDLSGSGTYRTVRSDRKRALGRASYRSRMMLPVTIRPASAHSHAMTSATSSGSTM